MSELLDDGEFWLPSQFLTEEDILTDFDISTPKTDSTTGFNSDLGSPVESVTETESDEDEFLAGLTRRMARSALLQDSNVTNPKGWVFSGSPQSTLCPGGDGSSRGSPTGPVSPPPASAKGDYLDLLHAAAGEVAKMRMKSEKHGTGYFDSSRGLLCAQRKQSNPVSPPPPKVNNTRIPNFPGLFSHQSHQQLQAFQFQQLWSQEMMKQQSKGAVSRNSNGEELFPGGRSNHLPTRPLGLSPSAWPPLQHPANRQLHPPARNPPVSGMRAVFVGTPGPKRESVGTGVFLPRRVNNPSEARKNSNKSDSTGRLRGHSNGVHAPRRNSDNSRSSGANLEIQLPSEWTY